VGNFFEERRIILHEELLTYNEKAKLLEVRIYEMAKAKKLWKPKIKSIPELHSFVKRALHHRDVYRNPLIQTVFQVWRTAGSADLKDVLELTTEYLTILDDITVKEIVLMKQEAVQEPEIQQPEYIQALVNKGLLFSDGKRIINNLDTVACELRDKGILVTKRFLQESFRQPDGNKYSDYACKLAVNKANTV